MSHRLKRKAQSPPSRSGLWDCSVCTYKNTREAFKCRMCDTRKGTSTRKPRLNAQVVEVQQHIQQAIISAARVDQQQPSVSGSGSVHTDKNHGEHSFSSSDPSETASSPLAGSSSAVKKPRANAKPQLVQRTKSTDESSNASSSLAAAALAAEAAKTVKKTVRKPRRSYSKPPKLKGVDRSTARHLPVTVNGVTVIITDFKPRPRPSTLSNRKSAAASIPATSGANPTEQPPAVSSAPVTPAVDPQSSASDSTRSPSPAGATGVSGPTPATSSATNSTSPTAPAAVVDCAGSQPVPRPPVTTPAAAFTVSASVSEGQPTANRVREGSVSEEDSNS